MKLISKSTTKFVFRPLDLWFLEEIKTNYVKNSTEFDLSKWQKRRTILALKSNEFWMIGPWWCTISNWPKMMGLLDTNSHPYLSKSRRKIHSIFSCHKSVSSIFFQPNLFSLSLSPSCLLQFWFWTWIFRFLKFKFQLAKTSIFAVVF